MKLSREEEAACQVKLFHGFPNKDLVIISQVFNKDQFGEGLTILGASSDIDLLHPHLRKLLNKGGDDYFWDSLRRIDGGLFLHLEEVKKEAISRLLLVEWLVRRDMIVYADLCLSNSARLEVTTPWGEVVRNSSVGLPLDKNGSIILGF